MTRTADRKSRQPHNAELHSILFQHLAAPPETGLVCEALRNRLDALEVADKLTASQGLALRACLEVLADHLDDANSLIESAADCADNLDDRILVLHVTALVSLSSGDDVLALRAALDAVWLNSDPRLWTFFLMVAHQTHRTDVVEATLTVFARSNFLDDEDLECALCCDENLDVIREYEAYQRLIAPRFTSPNPTNGN